jgi:hypothetical protein
LNFDELLHLMRISHLHRRNASEFLARTVATLQNRFMIGGDYRGTLRTTQLALLVSVCQEVRWGNREQLAYWRNHLRERQRPETGGWPSLPGETGSIIPTVFALRALIANTKSEERDAIHQGFHFLDSQLDAYGWSGIGTKGDTYSQAHLLRLLAETPQPNYRLVQEGVEIILSKRNSDGGWGGDFGEPSNIECTSLALVALVTSGAARFVPASLAMVALEDLNEHIATSTTELSELRDRFDAQVQLHCGQVVSERDQLNKKIAGLQVELRRAQVLLTTAEAQPEAIRRLAPVLMAASRREGIVVRNPYVIVSLGVAAAALGIVASYISEGSVNWWIPLVYSVVIPMMSMAMIYIVPKRFIHSNREPTTFADDSGNIPDIPELESGVIRRLRRDFLRLSEEWPVSLREEVTYRLFAELIRLPADIAGRYVEDLVIRLGMRGENRERFEQWARAVAKLTPSSRRILFEQIRRMF